MNTNHLKRPFKQTILLTFLITFCTVISHAKGFPERSSQDIFKTNCLIENNGQFNHFAPHIKKIDFALHHKNSEAYFSAKGFQFHMLEQELIDQAKEKEEKVEFRKIVKLVDEDWFAFEWIGANPNAKVEKIDKTSHYFTYGTKEYLSYGFEKIIYKEMYPGVDVIYNVHPKGGIEYSLQLAPNADLSKVKFKYTSQLPSNLKVTHNEIIVSNNTGHIAEEGLQAFYSNGEKIKISYQNNNGIISFKTDKKLDRNRSFTIDPWVTAATALTGAAPATHGFDVDYDVQGNLLVMGGGGASNSNTNSPKVAKYDINGNLLWTFPGFVVAPAWSSAPANSQSGYIGNFVVDKLTSKIYMSQGYRGAGAIVVRLDVNGLYDNFISTANPQMQEIWEMKFNCNSGDLIALGGGTNSNLNFGIIDTTTGLATTSNFTGIAGAGQDIACASLDVNGELYVNFASVATVNNRIYKLDQTYTVAQWNVQSGFTTMQELANRPNSGFASYGNGINCLSNNANYLFYYDGRNLKAFNKTTGATVGNSYNTNLQAKFQYGIYTTDCNEVYIGMNNGTIEKFLFNGTNFVVTDTLIIPGYPTGSVYDIVYNPITDQLIVSGEGFVASLNTQSNCTSSGAAGSINLSYNLHCPDSATVTVTNAAAGDSYSFTWIDSNTSSTLASVTTPSGTSTHGIGGLVQGNTIQVVVTKATACLYISNDTSFVLNCADTTIYRKKCPGDTIHVGQQIISTPGTYYDTLTNSSNQDSLVIVIFDNYPTYSQTADVAICLGDSYTLPDNSVVNQADTYPVLLLTENGCDSLITTNLTIRNSLPTTVKSIICSTDFYTLPDNSTTNIAGIYTDTLTDQYGCDSIIITELEVRTPGYLNIGPDTILCLSNPLLLDATQQNAASYLWNDMSTNSTLYATTPGVFYVTVSAPPCPPLTDSITITQCSCSIFVPNAFTPNNDGRNDTYKPIVNCATLLQNYEFSIFNRWGQKVFYTRSTGDGWDGTFRGVEQPTSSYYYTVRFVNPHDKEEEFHKGDVTLIR